MKSFINHLKCWSDTIVRRYWISWGDQGSKKDSWKGEWFVIVMIIKESHDQLRIPLLKTWKKEKWVTETQKRLGLKEKSLEGRFKCFVEKYKEEWHQCVKERELERTNQPEGFQSTTQLKSFLLVPGRSAVLNSGFRNGHSKSCRWSWNLIFRKTHAFNGVFTPGNSDIGGRRCQGATDFNNVISVYLLGSRPVKNVILL